MRNMSQGPGHHKAQELQVSAENSWTRGSGEETRAQPEEETGPCWSVPRRAGCHPGKRWAVLQPQTEICSGGCSLGGIWDLLWVGALFLDFIPGESKHVQTGDLGTGEGGQPEPLSRQETSRGCVQLPSQVTSYLHYIKLIHTLPQ
mgnify:FL=1